MIKTENDAIQVSSRPTVNQRLLFLFRFAAGPLMFFVAGLALLALLGVAQRTGWISSGGSASGGESTSGAEADVDYICPMMCTPPQKEGGRCPVCAMELVAASGGDSGGDDRSIVVDAATRRVANIQTVSVERIPLQRTIRSVGEIAYDEGRMKTISAYTNGRFDRMYVEHTGAVVRQGDRMAEFYSPDLHSAQVEYLQARDAASKRNAIDVVADANARLSANSRQRLLELGMTESQIGQLKQNRKALSRLDIVSPMQGTVIERLAVEGEYVKEGQPVFRLADLSTVWLLLELFPQDVATVRVGYAVEAVMKSMPAQSFSGRIEFIDPQVDAQSRTVSVRVVLDNDEGLIRVGDYATATIEVPLFSDSLAEYGGLVVPRNAVLSAANESVVYVETETGRFEIRRVVTGPTVGDKVLVLEGLAEGNKVATSGNFLLDSQMQLAGNPSLIDPSRAMPPMEMIAGFSAKELAEIQQLPDDDQSIAIEQVICPVTEYKLGSMGVPPKVDINGKTVFICCEGCREILNEEPAIHLAKLENYKSGSRKVSEEESFDVPEIVGITPIVDGGESLSIEPIGEDESFEIKVPEFDSGEVEPAE